MDGKGTRFINGVQIPENKLYLEDNTGAVEQVDLKEKLDNSDDIKAETEAARESSTNGLFSTLKERLDENDTEVENARTGEEGEESTLKDRIDKVEEKTVYAVTASGADTITATSNLTSYYTGLKVNLKVQLNNTTSTTLNINSLGAKSIKRYFEGAKIDTIADSLKQGEIVQLQYDGTDFIVVNDNADDYEEYSAGSVNITNESLKILPSRPSYFKLLKTYCPNFYQNWLDKDKDIVIVSLGESINTANNYSSDRLDSMYRPPLCHEYTLFSYLEEKLRWPEQKYKRFDVPATFAETGTPQTLEHDSNWDWQVGYPVGGLITTPSANFRPAITRVLTGTNCSVSYKYPAYMRRCDFIHRTDYQAATKATVSITEGNGVIEVYDEDTSSWIEANGYEFTQKVADSLIDYTVTAYTGATEARKRRESTYQKRLKMRSLGDTSEKTVTITNDGSGRLLYWGIQCSTNQYMIDILNQSRGGHDISCLRAFETQDVDNWQPDLIIQQCSIINDGAMSAYNMPVTNTVSLFTGRFETYLNALLGKAYSPEILTFMVGLAAQFLMYDKTHDIFDSGFITGSPNTPVNVFNYINELQKMYEDNNILHINMIYKYIEIAKQKAVNENSNIYDCAIAASSEDGTTFTIDGTHLNKYGNDIAKEILLPLFEQY